MYLLFPLVYLKNPLGDFPYFYEFNTFFRFPNQVFSLSGTAETYAENAIYAYLLEHANFFHFCGDGELSTSSIRLELVERAE